MAANRSTFDGETSNGASRSDLNCSFIAAYCDRRASTLRGLSSAQGLLLLLFGHGASWPQVLREWKVGQVLGARRLRTNCCRKR